MPFTVLSLIICHMRHEIGPLEMRHRPDPVASIPEYQGVLPAPCESWVNQLSTRSRTETLRNPFEYAEKTHYCSHRWAHASAGSSSAHEKGPRPILRPCSRPFEPYLPLR